ncbi:MAG: hypothetical protein JNL64_00425 [Blastocatellia bacterium]|jgi:hypothetical protein|nr:hypothetical protein [Blastocatellia bacterium]
MRIQEMRSGLEYLRKRPQSEFVRIDLGMELFGEMSVEPFETERTLMSELEEPRWSVVSFDRIEAGGLTYRQAAELMILLDSHKLTGLCVVSDEAAARMNR